MTIAELILSRDDVEYVSVWRNDHLIFMKRISSMTYQERLKADKYEVKSYEVNQSWLTVEV